MTRLFIGRMSTNQRIIFYLMVTAWILVLFLWWLLWSKQTTLYLEPYTNQTDLDLEYYVIHHRPNKEREINVNLQQQILGKPIHIFDAIMGKDLDMNHLQAQLHTFDDRLQSNYRVPTNNAANVHGCYLSHFMLIKQLMNENKQGGYTVVFEDDFKLLDDHLDDSLRHILRIVAHKDFDMVYLGNLSGNHGENIAENVFEVDLAGFLYGTHAYLINNHKLSKIYESLLNLNEAIDMKYHYAVNSRELNALVVYPVLVEQNGSPSMINDQET